MARFTWHPVLRAGAVFSAVLITLICSACGRYMKLDGTITRVRAVTTGSGQDVLVAEFDITNTAKVPYIVRDAELQIPDGPTPLTGTTIAVRDVQTLCEHMAALNHDCAQPLMARETIAPGATVRRLVAASFPKSAQELEQRKGLLVRIRELDRMETELREKR
ncbi:MAG: hypothetical protein LC114_01440 [Bryobacterales bacterium]|nr:hypothetical protein [Bryobacterales bacterium]